MSDAWLPRRLAYAPFDVLNHGDPSVPDVATHLRRIPSQHPAVDQSSLFARYPGLQTLHSEHAEHAASCTIGGSSAHPSAFFLARAIEDGGILELRWLKYISNTQHVQDDMRCEQPLHPFAEVHVGLSAPSAPELFQFPAPLLADISIFADDRTRTLQLLCVTVTGYLYRLTFKSPNAFHARSLHAGWVTEHRVSGLAGIDEQGRLLNGRIGQKAIAVHPGMVLVTCNDGTIVKLEQKMGESHASGFDGPWQETLLQTTSFVRNLTRYFSRSSIPGTSLSAYGGDVEASSPLAALSIATHVNDQHTPYAFVICRDRKLRVWDLVADTCIRTMDLPVAASSWDGGDADRTDAGEVTSRQGEAILGPDAKPLIEVVLPDADNQSGYDLYLMVHVPTSGACGNFFVYYGLEILPAKAGSTSNALGDIVRIWDTRCEPDTRSSEFEFRDIAVLPYGTSGLRLWALWDDTGGPLLKSTIVVEDVVDGDASYVSIAANSSPTEWSTIADWRPYLPLHGAAFEASIAAVAESKDDLAEFFLERMFEAGRFSERALQAALAEYEGGLLRTLADVDVPLVLSADTTFATLRDHMACVVGCNCSLDTDPSVGNALTAQYLSALRREWMKILGFVEQFESAARWPLRLIRPDVSQVRSPQPTATQSQPLIATRDYAVAIAVEDATSALLRISTQIHEGTDPQLGRRALVTAKGAAAEQAFLIGDGQSSAATRRALSQGFEACDDHGDAIFSLLSTAHTLAEGIPADRLELFRRQLLLTFSGKLGESVEDAVARVWEATLEDIMGTDTFQFLSESCLDLRDGLNENLLRWSDMLLEGFRPDKAGAGAKVGVKTDLQSAWVIDDLTASLRTRRASAGLMVLLLASMWVSNGLQRSVPSLPILLSRSMSVMHLCNALLDVADLEGAPDACALVDPAGEEAADQDALTQQFSSMQVATQGVSVTGPVTSPLHYACQNGLLYGRSTVAGGEDEDEEAEEVDVNLTRHAMAALSALLAPVVESPSGWLPALSPPFSLLAYGLIRAGYAKAAEAIITQFAPCPAGSYIEGCFAVAKGMPDAAMQALDKVGLTLNSADALLEDESGLTDILPAAVSRIAPGRHALALFNRHAGNLFGTIGSVEGIARYGSAALQHGLNQALASDPVAVSEVWFSTFRAQLQLGDFQAAYRTIMSSADDSFKRDCIRSLVTAICEAGHVSTLLSFNFAGSQGELERTLSFKARNSDPFAMPNYFKILYAYHMNRGDMKSAGAVMYQQSHQLASLQRMGYRVAVRAQEAGYEQFEDIASVQARSFLAAMNVLNLVHPRDAWFANVLPVDGNGADADAREQGEQQEYGIFGDIARQKAALTPSRTTHYIPTEEFTEGTKNIEIVRLDDIKREYQLLLARLELSRGYAELAAPRSKLSAADAVALYLRNDRYDQALATACALGVDM
ncbi:hypothetical protein K437DRAFT_257384, partial [Tilletiaria anomala UBC 951]